LQTRAIEQTHHRHGLAVGRMRDLYARGCEYGGHDEDGAAEHDEQRRRLRERITDALNPG
jgi:hypothetical protein